MTDWGEYLARGRHRIEAALWILAASVVALAVLGGAALATWLDLRAGKETGLEEAILIELDSLPPVEALAEIPAAPPPPEVETALPDTLAEAPPPEDAPPTAMPADSPPAAAAEPAPEPPQPDLADAPLDALPDVAPEPPPQKPEPAPEPVAKPVVKPAAKPVAKPAPEPAAKPQKKPKPARKPEPAAEARPSSKPAQEAQQGRVGSQAPKGSSNASQLAKWQSKVQGQLVRQLKKKTFGAKAALTLIVSVNGAGTITDIGLSASSGNPKVDAAVLAQARRLRSVPAPPDGQPKRLKLPAQIR